VVTGSRHAALARAFADRLSGPESQAVLRQLGFQPPLPGSR
jgi:ABC-type molybdate transport system substrate-binding protein